MIAIEAGFSKKWKIKEEKLAQLTVTPMEKDIKEKTQIKHMQTKSKRKEGEGLPDNLFPS